MFETRNFILWIMQCSIGVTTQPRRPVYITKASAITNKF